MNEERVQKKVGDMLRYLRTQLNTEKRRLQYAMQKGESGAAAASHHAIGIYGAVIKKVEGILK